MARRKSHTPKYGEKVLRQVHSDLATVLKDADSLLKHLDHPQVHNAMVKELQQIVKAIDRIEFMAKKAYPGADKFDPFAEEEGAEQQQEQMDENGLPMDQDPNSENELEEEELHPELTSPEGNVQIGQPIATYSPLQTAEAAAIQGDAHLMGDRGSIAVASEDRTGKQPSPIEAIRGMELGMGPNGISNKLPGEKGFDINQLSPQDAQDMLDYLDGGHGSADLLDGPGRRSVLPVEKRDGDIPTKEKAIVRMVQVKEHMRKMPNRKKLKSMTCPGCGGQGETCSCDQQPELQQEQQIQEGIDRNNIPDFPPAVQEAVKWLKDMQGRDFNLNEEEQQKAYHYYKTLEDFSKSWKRNLLAGTTGAVVALNANNILGNPYDHFMNNASTAIRRTINNTISAPAQPTKPNEKPTDSKSHAFHKEVDDGHPSAQRGHGDYIKRVYQELEARAPQKGMPSDDISPEKARQILHDGEVRGHLLTPAQRRMFGAAANKDQKQMGSMGTDGTDTMAGPASGDMSGTEMGSTGAMSLEDMTKYLLKMVG